MISSQHSFYFDCIPNQTGQGSKAEQNLSNGLNAMSNYCIFTELSNFSFYSNDVQIHDNDNENDVQIHDNDNDNDVQIHDNDNHNSNDVQIHGGNRHPPAHSLQRVPSSGKFFSFRDRRSLFNAPAQALESGPPEEQKHVRLPVA